MVDFFGGGDTGGGISNSFVQQNYQRDPRVIMAALLAQNGQRAIEGPTPNTATALAKALTMGLGGITQAGLASEYQNRDKAAADTMQQGIQALTGGVKEWTNPDTGNVDVPGQQPGIGAMASVLGKNPDTAGFGMQQALAVALMGQKAKIELANDLLKNGKRIVGAAPDGSPILGPVEGYGPAAAANEAPVAGAKERATLQAQTELKPGLERALIAPAVEKENALNTGTAQSAAAKAATVESATAPIKVATAVATKQGTAPIELANEKEAARYRNELDTGRLMSPDEVKAAGLPEGAIAQLDGKNNVHIVYNPNTPLSPDTIAKYTLVKEGADAAQRLKAEIGNPSAKELLLAQRNGTLASYLNSDKGRQIKQLAEIAIGNRLRITSGAAVTQGEIESEMSKYFPNAGDDQATAQRKINSLTGYYDTFGGMAPPNARGGMAPPTPAAPASAAGSSQPGAPPQITTKSDYDALPKGSQYLDPTGRARIKQ